MPHYIGVDLSGWTSGTHVAVLDGPANLVWDGHLSPVAVQGKTSFVHDEVLASFLSTPPAGVGLPATWDEASLAIDAPFGWPESFRCLLNSLGRAVDPSAWGPLLKAHWRATETYLIGRSVMPLNAVRSDFGQLGVRSMYVLSLISGAWHVTIDTPAAQPWRRVIEVYPKATRKLASQAHQNAIANLVPPGSNSHRKDAIAAAYTAYMWAQGLCVPFNAPGLPVQRAQVEKEGWIMVPA